MPSAPSEKRTEDQSFLRTGAEPHHAHAVAGGSNAGQHHCPQRLYPPPPVEPAVAQQVSNWRTFGVWAIHMDAPLPGSGAVTEALEKCLGHLERSSKALWFNWRDRLYGCALPEVDAGQATRMARRLQKTLGRQRVETISIGVSVFPCLDFDRHACFHNACKALDHAAFLGPGSVVAFDAVSLNISADYRHQEGRLDDAIAEYRDALRLDPVNVNVHNSLGGCLAQKEDWTGARAAFETALRIDPRDAMAAYNLGVLHLLEGQNHQALAQFKQAYRMDKQLFDIPFQIGKLLTEQRSHAKARPYLEAALALRADCAAVYSLLGSCLAALGHTREAINACKKAVKINPNDAGALSELGSLYDTKGENPDICITFCRQSVALCPDNGLFRMRLADMYDKHDQLDAALAEYEAAAGLGCDTGSRITDLRQRMAAAPNGRNRYAS